MFNKNEFGLIIICSISYFISIGSDGFLYSNKLFVKSNRYVFPGKKLTEINLVNPNKPVTLTQLNLDCIGLYGAEPK